MSAMPSRALRLTLSMGADTKEDLVRELESLALRIDREELSIGVSGGVYAGYTYELLSDPSMTHARYFDELRQHLAESREGPKA